jgi:deazaflavin-dependent oxidoreductase (nitroreductase family)
MNPLICFLVRRFGLGGRGVDLLRILRVRGRKSGRLYEVPVRVAMLDDQRYIISMLGETQWARNLRQAVTAQLIVGKTVEPIRTREIQDEEKTAFLLRYCQYQQFAQRARFTLKAAFEVKVKHLASAEIDLLASVWSVFRLELEQNERATT